MTLITQLNTLESAGLIRVAQVEPELEYLFRHTLVQEAAYASLLTADRKRLHLVVGETVEYMYPDRLASRELAAKLARHFAEAGDEIRALRYYTLAGEAALASYANHEAERHYRRACNLAHSEVERAELLSGLGEALYGQSRFEEAIQTWREGIAQYQALGPEGSDGVARLYARSGRAAWHRGDTPGGLALCQEGLAAVGDAPESPKIALLVHEAARAYHFNGMLEEALPLCRQALEMAERVAAVDVQADALATLGILPDQPPEEALDALTKAVELAESAGLLDIAHRAHHNLGVKKGDLLGDLRLARDHYRRAAELAKKRGVTQEELLSRINALNLSLNLGELASVEETIPELEQLLSTISDPSPIELSLRGIKAGLLITRGQWQEALHLLQISQTDAHQRGDLQTFYISSTGIANVLLELNHLGELDNLKEAETSLTKAIEISDRGMGGKAWPRCLLSMVYARQERFNEARLLLSEVQEIVGPQSTIWEDASLITAEAELAYAEERWSEALALFESVAGIAARLEIRPWWARMLLRWAEVHISRGDPTDLERALTLLREALETFKELGYAYFSELVEQIMRETRTKSYAQALAHQKAAQELAQAGKIQESFLPEELPHLPGWQLSATLKPARETSGDYYDFIPLPDDRLGIVVADVAGKGAAAALYMASSRTLIRTYVEEYPSQPELVLSNVNRRILMETHAGLFITGFYGILDPSTSKLTYCNAGHNPPLLLRAQEDSVVQALHKTGMALGIIEDVSWEQGEVELEPGDLLMIFTDGLTDAQNEDEEMFGEERIIEVAQANFGRPSQENLDAMLAAVQNFVGDAPQYDDLTLVVVIRDVSSW